MATRRNYRRGDWTRTKPSRGKLWGFLLLVAAVVGAVGYLLVFSPLFQVKQVKIEGARTLPADELRGVALEAAERRFGPLHTRSYFLIDRGAVTKGIMKEFPDVSEVNVETDLPDTLVLDVSERRSTLLWKTGEQSYLVDQRGIAFAPGNAGKGLVAVEDSTKLPVEVGKRVVGSNFITILEQIRQSLKERGIKVTSFRIPETTFEVQAVTGQGWYALFDTTRPVTSQADALKLAIAREKPFQYADLRVPGRVYVR